MNDVGARRLVMLDPNLGKPTTVLDSVGGRDNSYGPQGGLLIPFRGDSTLYLEHRPDAFLVLDPLGKVARVMAAPVGPSGAPLAGPMPYSPILGLTYRPIGRVTPAYAAQFDNQRPAAGAPEVTMPVDAIAYVVAMDLTTRAPDTLSSLYMSRQLMRLTSSSTTFSSLGLLYSAWDAWTVATDGSVAVLRAREYRIDWIGAGKVVTVGPRIPYDWKHLTDAEKASIADSVNRDRKRSYDANVAKWVQDSIDIATGRVAGPPRTADTERRGSSSVLGTPGRPPAPMVVDPMDIPDYLPPVPMGNAVLLADADTNLWIRTRWSTTAVTPPAGAPVIYDVVNRRGELADRVEVPDGRTIVGFAPGGLVYILAHDGGTAVLQQIRVR